MVEYNALIIGLKIAEALGVKYLESYGNSKLVITQIKGEYEIRNKDLVLYHRAIIAWVNKFMGFYIKHMPRKDNAHVP